MSANNKVRLLILYTELAAYTLACLEKFCTLYPGATVLLIHWPVNKEAPFQFGMTSDVKAIPRDSLDQRSLLEKAESFSPDLILCSGWVDKEYVAVCKKYSGKIPTVLLMDNKWEGNLKQHLASLVSSATFIRNFSHAWVPGEAQKKFALKLGFIEKNIRTGFYSADTEHFSEVGKKMSHQKKEKYPHRFIYVGRYYDFKGVNEMWSAFEKLRRESKTDWELWCAGTGDIVPPAIEGVRHFGFVQPSQLEELMKETSVFILPSKVEPWGVVVHEFAAAGFPLLLSDKVGAAEKFLEEGKNGFSFKAGDVNEIFTAMKKIMTMTPEQLLEMGEKSRQLASAITTETWARTLHELGAVKVN
jgi:glycosyltransferase involved in cell wall biosynthesis